MRTRLKVCCIASIDEARIAIAAGADAIGLVARMPSGPGQISDTLIREIATSVPPPVAAFLLTSEADPDAVVAHVQRCGVSTVQLVDDGIDPSVYAALREACPATHIVQVVHVQGPESVDVALAAAGLVDALLLDSGNPAAATRELGGTGRVHDWSFSREVVRQSPAPVFLAGGLHPDNVSDAIRTVRPYGIDLCSGVRTDGELDREKLAALVLAIHKADQQH